MAKEYEFEVTWYFAKFNAFCELQRLFDKFNISYKTAVYFDEDTKVYEISWDNAELSDTANADEIAFEYAKILISDRDR